MQSKVKFISFLTGIDLHADTTNVYYNTWAKEFLDTIDTLHNKQHRLLGVKLGDSFTMAISDEKDIYSWGLNDYS